MAFSFGNKTLNTTAPAAAEVPDVEVPNPPSDSISSMAFAPNADFLAVGSWDNQVRIYEISGNITGKASFSAEGPIMDVCWSKDGSKLFGVGADKTARMFDVSTGQTTQVAAHDQPIKSCKWADMHGGFLCTASWDKTLKYWDLRQSQPIASVQLEERAYSMDVAQSLLVVATAERKIQIYNLGEPTKQYDSTVISPLKFQTRTVSCFPDASGYALGSIEGRVAMQYIDKERAKTGNFSFKCHRQNEKLGITEQKPQLHCVNAISWHTVHGTFSTVGSDGTLSFWDKENKTRLKTFPARGGPIVCSAFNYANGGMIFAYGMSYDWNQGYRGHTAQVPTKIMLHACKDDEVKRRSK